jgi:uncharacterized protein
VGLPLPDTTLLVLGCFAALLVGLSKGGLPTVGMLAVPVMALKISPVTAAVLLLPIFVMTDMVGVYLYRRDFSLRNVKILIPAGMAGVLFGWAVASHLSDKGVALLIGLLGVGFCLNIWLRPAPAGEGRPGSVGWGWFWGSLAGFTSFVSHAGAPPYQIYVLPQRLKKITFAGTSTIVFAAINLSKVVPYMQLRPYSMADLRTVAWLVPTALLGTVLGAWLTRHMPDTWFFRLVQVGLFSVSIKLIFDALFS